MSEQQETKGLTRRQALKILAATTGVTALSSLPSKWAKPILKVGVLPAHAQTSPAQHIIVFCSANNVQGGGVIGPTDTITMQTGISPASTGISIRRTITLNEAAHPQNGVIDVVIGLTDAAGEFTGPDFDLSTISPEISPGIDRISILWEFVNPAEGTGTCQRNIEITVLER
jgi:hypothetical protein